MSAKSDPATTARQVPGPLESGGRLLVAGDTHGNLDWIRTLARLAARYGCDGLVQLGDFGLWPVPDSDGEVAINHGWLRAVADACAHHGVWVRAIDGNHDAHPLARDAFPARADDGVRPIVDQLLDWADRGSVWEWSGVRFGALGGGVSIDKSRRVERISWWPTEEITDTEVQSLIERAGSDGVDVLLTHDAPMLPPRFRELPMSSELRLACARSRARVEWAVQATRPSLHLHGHLHVRHSSKLELDDRSAVQVECLASDQERAIWGESWAVLELDDGRATFVDAHRLKHSAISRSATRSSP